MMDSLHDKLVMIALAVGEIPKDKTNPHFKYDYASAEQFIEAVRGPMLAHGVLILPQQTCEWVEQTKGVAARLNGAFIITDGKEKIQVAVPGEGWDMQDKACYKAMTGAFKYLLRTVFAVPMTDDPEKDTGACQARGAEPRPAQSRRVEAPQEPLPGLTGKIPEGLRFEMPDVPHYKSGDHVFAKGPNSGDWNGWTWNKCASAHADFVAHKRSESPIQNMLMNEQYIKGWNREQVEEIDRRVRAQYEATRPVNPPPDSADDFDLDSCPF